MRNSNIYINCCIKKHQKFLFSVSFSILILCLHSCIFLPDPDKDKYEIINLVLAKQLESEYKSFKVSDKDTLKLKNLIVDKFTRPKFVIAPSGQGYKIRICGMTNDHLKFNNYFDIKDLDYLKECINNEKSLELDRSRIIRNDLLIDYSSFLPIDSTRNTINSSFEAWDKFHESEYNYSSICEPLISTSKDKAIIGMNICVSDYFLIKLFSLSKNKEGVWNINSQMTVIDKFVEQPTDENDSKSKESLEKVTYIIYVRTIYE